jgi:hypothetical protein
MPVSRFGWLVPVTRWPQRPVKLLSVLTLGQTPHAACTGLCLGEPIAESAHSMKTVTPGSPSSETGDFTNQNSIPPRSGLNCQWSDLGSFRDHSVFQKTPQIDKQPAGQGHDANASHAAPTSGKPFLEPLA